MSFATTRSGSEAGKELAFKVRKISGESITGKGKTGKIKHTKELDPDSTYGFSMENAHNSQGLYHDSWRGGNEVRYLQAHQELVGDYNKIIEEFLEICVLGPDAPYAEIGKAFTLVRVAKNRLTQIQHLERVMLKAFPHVSYEPFLGTNLTDEILVLKDAKEYHEDRDDFDYDDEEDWADIVIPDSIVVQSIVVSPLSPFSNKGK